MWHVDLRRALSDDEHRQVIELIGSAGGERPLSDHLWLDLLSGGRPGFVAALGTDSGRLAAYAQASTTGDGHLLGVVGDDPAGRAAVAGAVLSTLRADAAGHVEWWVTDPSPADIALAAEHGLAPGRLLRQMRRSLPIDATTDVVTRPFVVGQDEQAWLEVNNAAFAAHPEQGGWDLETLRLREGESWFDPDGFLLHERDGVLAAFCWTKVHDELEPPAGEIYVIAADPRFHGLGLGKALTVAGLQHLAGTGLRQALLYVDDANAAAVGLYEHLGFHTHRVDQAFSGTTR
jgi:mycothiol synthase